MRPLPLALVIVLVAASSPATASTNRLVIAHDHLGPPQTVTFDIEAGSSLSAVFIWFKGNWVDPGPRAFSVSEGPGASIRVRDPTGTEIWSLRHTAICATGASASDPFDWGCGPFVREEFDPPTPLAAGTWTAEFSGVGFTTGEIQLYGVFA